MSSNLIFVDRRQGQERRSEQDVTAASAVDTLQHKPRKTSDRRDRARNLLEDYYAYMRKYLGKTDYVEAQRAGKAK